MNEQLTLSIGQYSTAGRKAENQDFNGVRVPLAATLALKGAVVALADGISSSAVSAVASETAVRSLMDDYYCTSEAWPVKKSVSQVLNACNSWLYATSRNSDFRYEPDKGYVCTLSALVFKADTAHMFHVGDSRVYRLDGNGLEQLSNDHRAWLSEHESHLSRAMGYEAYCEFDYKNLRLKLDDIYILATDGVYEYVEAAQYVHFISQYAEDLDAAAKAIVEYAYSRGSEDNLTLQIVQVTGLPEPQSVSVVRQVNHLPLPPILDARAKFDGYTIVREIHASARSHVYIATDDASGEKVVIKTPSIDLSGDPAYLERLLTEEWVARRINNAHVLKAGLPDRQRNYLYTVFEYVEGQTLAQWITDNPNPSLEQVRDIIEQAAKGLRAFHRMEMLHQDLKPDNILIDHSGTVKIIDFGSVQVAGIEEALAGESRQAILGTALYTAPEYFIGGGGTALSEQFSLATICYHMLTGTFPYGTQVSQCRTAAQQRRLKYRSVLNEERELAFWLDETLRKALQVDPYKRYESISEFIYDLRHPNRAYQRKVQPPLIDRNPVVFWQGVSAILAVAIVILLASKH